VVVNTILHVGVLHEKVEEGWKGVIRRLQDVSVEKNAKLQVSVDRNGVTSWERQRFLHSWPTVCRKICS
jgi:hypothetical protein